MSVIVECICSSKFEVDPKVVDVFECTNCQRRLQVPTEAVSNRLQQIRNRMRQGEPGVREAMRDAAAMHGPHALPLLRAGAESGVREAVNTSLSALCEAGAEGESMVAEWIEQGRLSVSRLISAFREQKYDKGSDYLCRLIDADKLKENQIAEAASYLGESGTPQSLETLKVARRAYPNLGNILDDAMLRMRHLDETAGGVPDEAKRIPGRESAAHVAADAEDAPSKRGCMGLVVLGLLVAGGAAVATVLL